MNDEDIKLVYQPVPPVASSEAFASALNTVLCESETVDIASPYLSFDVVESLIQKRCFRLVTDLDACFEGRESERLADFFEKHQTAIRSITGLHAKVVLGAQAGLLGSANLTRMGLSQRFEMACIVRGGHFKELAAWFEAVWKHASPLAPEAIRTGRERATSREHRESEAVAVKRLPTTGNLGWLKGAASGASGQRQGKSALPMSLDSDFNQELKELAKQIRALTTTRVTAHRALELFDEALRLIGLPVDDDRLHLNFGRGPISITLGQRYVIWLKKKKGGRKLGMLLSGLDVAERYAERKDVCISRFRANGELDVPAFYWPLDDIANLPVDVLESWRRGIQSQRERCGKSSYVRKKRPALYHLVKDAGLRSEIVRHAYPAG